MEDIYSKVLFIGPLNLHGGIGAVLRTYQKNVPHFNFIATHKDQSKATTIVHFILSLIRINIYLSTNQKIKIVHIHSASKGSFIRKILVAMFAKLFQKKVIFHMHGGQFKEYFNSLRYQKPFFIYLLNKVDLFICLTQEWETYFKKQLGLKHVVVVGNPVAIAPELIQKPASDSVTLLFLGTLNKKKGIFDLLNYIHTNEHFKNKHIRLKIGGIGEIEKLKSIITETKYLDQIEYLGFLNEEKKYEAIESADIFILPSYYEGLPVSILEVLGHGKPVIATRVGGVSSVVKEQENGWLFDAGSFHQLDAIFDEIVTHQYPLEEYQRNAYKMVEKYACKHIVLQLSEEYKKLLI